MFTEYALNALLKQTYARAPFLPLLGRTPPERPFDDEGDGYISRGPGVNPVTSRETSRRRWKKSAESLPPPPFVNEDDDDDDDDFAPSRFPRPIRPTDLFARTTSNRSPSPPLPSIEQELQEVGEENFRSVKGNFKVYEFLDRGRCENRAKSFSPRREYVRNGHFSSISRNCRRINTAGMSNMHNREEKNERYPRQ